MQQGIHKFSLDGREQSHLLPISTMKMMMMYGISTYMITFYSKEEKAEYELLNILEQYSFRYHSDNMIGSKTIAVHPMLIVSPIPHGNIWESSYKTENDTQGICLR